MISDFGLDYFLLVFVASLGVLQLAAAHSRLYGLLLLNRVASFILGPVLVVLAFTWFFASGARNVPDTAGGLDGNQQWILFFAGAVTALVLMLLLSSLIRRSMAGDGEHARGLEALRHTTYLRALMKGLNGRGNGHPD